MKPLKNVFGNLQSVREECRDARGANFGESTLQDIRFGLRVLGKNPGFTAIAVLTLALGIGASTAIFSVVNTVLLQPLAFHDPHRLVMLWEAAPKQGPERGQVSYPNYQDWLEQNQVFESMSVIGYAGGTLAVEAGAISLQGAAVSSSFFPLLGVKPFLGRGLVAGEDQPGSERVVILMHGFWQNQYGGDTGMVGRQIRLDTDLYTVVGVMPSDFQPFDGPLMKASYLTSLAPLSGVLSQRGCRCLQVIARLKREVSLVKAQTEIGAIHTRSAKQYPENRGQVVTVTGMRTEIVKGVRTALWVLLAVVGFVLLIVCANLANLLLTKASARVKEMGIRAALGATTGRLIRQTLVESILLAGAGGMLGLALAFWGVWILRGTIGGYIPRAEYLRVDGTVLAFTLFVSAAAGLLFGCAPAVLLIKRNILSALQKGVGRSTGTGHRALQDVLVVAEVALTLALLIGAGLLGRSFLSVIQTDLGLQPENMLTFTVNLPGPQYASLQSRQSFWREVIQKTETLPGVKSVGATGSPPFRGGMAVGFEPLDGVLSAPKESRFARFQSVSAGFFQAVGATLLKGRFFDTPDMEGAGGKLIINETMARRFWRDEDPIGRRLKISMSFGDKNEPEFYEIVGVIRDIKQERIEAEVMPEMSVPFSRLSFGNMTFTVKTTIDPKSLVLAVQKVVADLDRGAPVTDVRTMKEWIGDSIAQRRFSAVMLGSFSLLALFLAAIGVYGVMAFAVSARRQEIGIRMALGAQTPHVMGLVFKKGMALVGIGGALGLFGALAAGRVLRSMLYQTQPTDPIAFVVGSVVLIMVALLACWLPARRAAKIDPMIALRWE